MLAWLVRGQEDLGRGRAVQPLVQTRSTSLGYDAQGRTSSITDARGKATSLPITRAASRPA